MKGPKGTLSHTVAEPISLERDEDGTVKVIRPNDERANVRRNIATAQQDESWMKITSFSKPVEILEYWGRVPEDMSVTDENGEEVTELLITVADRAWVLNAVANPYWGRNKPFGAYRPFEDPHFFHSPGKVEVVEKLQVVMNRLANSRLDLLDLTIFPPMLYNENSGLMPRRMFSGPGAMIGVYGSVAEPNCASSNTTCAGLRANRQVR